MFDTGHGIPRHNKINNNGHYNFINIKSWPLAKRKRQYTWLYNDIAVQVCVTRELVCYRSVSRYLPHHTMAPAPRVCLAPAMRIVAGNSSILCPLGHWTILATGLLLWLKVQISLLLYYYAYITLARNCLCIRYFK